MYVIILKQIGSSAKKNAKILKKHLNARTAVWALAECGRCSLTIHSPKLMSSNEYAHTHTHTTCTCTHTHTHTHNMHMHTHTHTCTHTCTHTHTECDGCSLTIHSSNLVPSNKNSSLPRRGVGMKYLIQTRVPLFLYVCVRVHACVCMWVCMRVCVCVCECTN